jgi:hypothetical protein
MQTSSLLDACKKKKRPPSVIRQNNEGFTFFCDNKLVREWIFSRYCYENKILIADDNRKGIACCLLIIDIAI